jgi:hypothetical protein
VKNSTIQGFDQHDNAQVAVDQESFLIVGETLSNHLTDQAEAVPTVDAIPPDVGRPEAAAWDPGSRPSTNAAALRSPDSRFRRIPRRNTPCYNTPREGNLPDLEG